MTVLFGMRETKLHETLDWRAMIFDTLDWRAMIFDHLLPYGDVVSLQADYEKFNIIIACYALLPMWTLSV